MTQAHRVEGVFRNATSTRTVPAGTVIFEAGDAGDEMFGIVEGEVELKTPHGKVLTLGVDDMFGEMALVDASPRSATATAKTDTVLATVDHHRFLFLVHETPLFALQVMGVMARRLRDQL